MSKVAHYLQEHLMGEVVASADARRYFATDGSILAIPPAIIVYPRNENDVRKTARFTWQLAERGRVIPMTARGAGTDTTGGSLGSGVILAFPAHMDHVLEFDDKSGGMTIEPGANYGKVQQTLLTHGRFLPPFPAGVEYSTIGGAVANNAGGDKSVKYGDTRDYVRGLRVVLANGEVIETSRLSRREFNKKLGLSTFEGELYRAVDALLEDNKTTVTKTGRAVTRNSAGYALSDIRRKDGSFDLTPLFVGSQGTLGIITEICVETEPHNPEPVLITADFDDLEKMQKAVLALRELPEMPSAIEMVDETFLNEVSRISPNLLKDVLTKPYPKAMLFIEFDSPSDRTQKKLVKKALKLLQNNATETKVAKEPIEQDQLWKIRQASSVIMGHSEGALRALPVIDDGIVPPERLREYIEGIYAIFEHTHLRAALWGHAGEGSLRMLPLLDLSEVGDRQKAIRLMDEYYALVIKLGGSISADGGDGRLRAPYLQNMYGTEVYELFQKIKQIFDPYNTLNPGVKVDVTLDTIKPLIRPSFSLDQLHGHLPKS